MTPLIPHRKPEYQHRSTIPLCPDPALLVIAWCRGKREVWQTEVYPLEIFDICRDKESQNE